MRDRIRAIIKRPDELVGHGTWIRNELRAFQSTVDGPIETIPCGDAVIICNEEGKIRDLPLNFRYVNVMPDMVRGTVIVCGVNGDGFADIPFGLATWRSYMRQWGNRL